MGNVNRDLQLVLHTQMMCIIVIVFIRCKLYLFEIKTSLYDHIVLMGDATQRSTVGNPAEQGKGRKHMEKYIYYLPYMPLKKDWEEMVHVFTMFFP